MRDDRMTNEERTTRTTDATRGDVRAGAAAGLARLEELDDYEVADGYPDPRGWDVKTRDGRTVGEVKNLLVDRGAMRVRYLEVELKDDVVPGGQHDRCVHVPVAQARLDDDGDDVIVDLDGRALAGLGLVDVSRPVPGGAYDDDRRFFGKRARGEGNAPYLVLHEEKLAVGKRAVKAGEVSVRKTVETEHVKQQVPVRREEVTVERHAISPEQARAMGGEERIGEDEIRVPVMREEVVAEKRVVPTEEVVVRKHAVTEDKTVEETVRKERAVVDDADAKARHRPDPRTR